MKLGWQGHGPYKGSEGVQRVGPSYAVTLWAITEVMLS